MGARPKVDDVRTDRALLDLWRRLESVEKNSTATGIANFITNNITLQQTITDLGWTGCLTFGATTTGTVSTPDWYLVPGGATSGASNSLVNSRTFVLPPQATRVIGLGIYVRIAGVPGAGSPNLDYLVVQGSTPVDTAARVNLATTFVGHVSREFDVPITPGNQLRVVQRRTNSITTSPTDMLVTVTLAAG